MPRAWPTALWPFGTPQLMSSAVRRHRRAEGTVLGQGWARGTQGRKRWVRATAGVHGRAWGIARGRGGATRGVGQRRKIVLRTLKAMKQAAAVAVARDSRGVLPPPLPPAVARP